MAAKGQRSVVIEVKGQESSECKFSEAKAKLTEELVYSIIYPALYNISEDVMQLIVKIERQNRAKAALLNNEAHLRRVIRNWLSHQKTTLPEDNILLVFLTALKQNPIDEVEKGKVPQPKRDGLNFFFKKCLCCKHATTPIGSIAPITEREYRLKETAKDQLKVLIDNAHAEIKALKTYVQNSIFFAYEKFKSNKSQKLIDELNDEVTRAQTIEELGQITDRLSMLSSYEDFDSTFKGLLIRLANISQLYQDAISALKMYKRAFGVWDITIESDPESKKKLNRRRPGTTF